MPKGKCFSGLGGEYRIEAEGSTHGSMGSTVDSSECRSILEIIDRGNGVLFGGEIFLCGVEVSLVMEGNVDEMVSLQCTCDGLSDPPRCVRAELPAKAWFKHLDGPQ